MRFSLDDEQAALRDSARRVLADVSSPGRVRQAVASTEGFDRAVWRQLAGELGWTAVAIPETYGGLGLGAVEVGVLTEEMGRHLFCSPWLATIGLGASTLLGSRDTDACERWLPGIASGDVLATVVWDLSATSIAVTSTAVTSTAVTSTAADSDGQGVKLTGTARGVLDGHVADLLIVPAQGSLFMVDGDARGLGRTRFATMDATRPRADLTFEATPATPLGTGDEALQQAIQRATILLAAEQTGGADACLDLSVDYARTRVQFGRPIGSFQAIKHKCADMLLQVESARSAAWWAGWVAAHDPDRLAEAAQIAGSYCAEAYFSAAAECIQVHGGIGFTAEHDAHLHFKRARASQGLFGTPTSLRADVADRLLGAVQP